ncbi:MAG: hypothetical protein AAF560_08690 [Acidobacteriota bacterium]
MLAAWVPLGLALFGGGVVAALLRRHGWSWQASWPYVLAMAPAVGFGLASLGFFFWVFAGFHPPGAWTLMGLMLGLALVLVGPVHGRQRSGLEDGSEGIVQPLFKVRPGWRLTWQDVIVALLVLVTLGLVVFSFFPMQEFQPFGFYDAVAIWNVRAFFLFRSQGDLGELYADLKFGHPDYPLLLPGTLAAQYSLLGREDVAIPQVTGLLFALSACLALALLVARYSALPAAVSAAVLIAVTPCFWRWLYAQYADLPLAYLLLLATLTLASQLEAPTRRLPATLAGFCFGLLTWIKNEGLVLAFLLAVSLVLVLLVTRDLRREWLQRGVWFGIGALPVLTALGLFKMFWSPQNETGMFLQGAIAKVLTWERWWIIIRALFAELNPVTGIAAWGLLWPFVIVAGVIFWRQRRAVGRPHLMISAMVVLAWATWFTIYLCTPADLEWHLGSSLKRLMLQLAPLTLAWSLLGVGRADEESRA